jgi:hypothetical protein
MRHALLRYDNDWEKHQCHPSYVRQGYGKAAAQKHGIKPMAPRPPECVIQIGEASVLQCESDFVVKAVQRFAIGRYPAPMLGKDPQDRIAKFGHERMSEFENLY